MNLSISQDTVERAARGDAAALEAVVADVWPHAYRMAAAILRDVDLAQDVAQDSCAAIVRGLPKLRNAKAFHGWWRRIVGTRTVDATRRRPNHVPLEAAHDVTVESNEADALDLHLALRSLPVTQRAAVVLHYYGGFDSREIAAITGQAASTVRFQLMLARRTLHETLRPLPDQRTASYAQPQEIPNAH